MENVRAIFMNIDGSTWLTTSNFFAIDITTQMWTFVYDKAFLTLPLSTISEGGAKKA
jgi:hypothetical protein